MSLLDGYNVSIKVCACVLGEVELSIEGRELKGESPVDTHPHIHPPHVNSGYFFFYLCLSYFIHSVTHTHTPSLFLSLWKKRFNSFP